MYTITVLSPLPIPTPAEVAMERAEQVLRRLKWANEYADLEKWGLAAESIKAAHRALQGCNQEHLDALTMKKILVGFRKARNRLHFKI